MKPRVYLDHAATTQCDPAVVAAMLPYFNTDFGNASTVYQEGAKARQALQQARGQVANLIGADPAEVVFTGSGTESNNLAVRGAALARRNRGRHVITSAIEHHSVLRVCEQLEKDGFEVTYLPVDKDGLVEAGSVAREIRGDTILVAVMHANNEIGTIQPIKAIGEITSQRDIFFHCDGVQTAGSIAVDVKGLLVDSYSLSAHKIYGPKGVGALYVKKGRILQAQMLGGGQEAGRRSATENVPGIVGFGAAAQMIGLIKEQEAARLSLLRNKLVTGLIQNIPDIRLNGHKTLRLPGIVNVAIKFVEGESMVLYLDAMGIAVSTGSACSAADLKASHVLLAIGLQHEIAHGSLRFSLGHSTTEDDIKRVIDVLPGIVEKLRAVSPLINTKVLC